MMALYPMPPTTADVAAKWAFLKEGLDHIMNFRTREPLSHAKYVAIYTVIFDYCNLARHSEPAMEKLLPEMYELLIGYFATNVEPIRNQIDAFQDEALLRFYASEWDRYTSAAKYMHRLFAPFDQLWTSGQRDEGREDIYPVYTLALVQWKTGVFISAQQRLTSCILRLIMRQRDGDAIDEGLVKKVVDSFVSLGLYDADVNQVCLDIYIEHFEAAFIDATKKYYKEKSDLLLAESSVSDYLTKTGGWLREEQDRVERYLNSRTCDPLLKKCGRILVQEHSELFSVWAQSVIDAEKYDDLQCVSALQSLIPEYLEFVRASLGEHIKKTGLAAVLDFVGEAGVNIDAVDPKAYVDTLLNVLEKTWDITPINFREDAWFLANLRNAYREFINRNAVTGASDTRSPELLAQYADQLLRKITKIAEDCDLETALNGVIKLLDYIEDKDVFQIFYTAKLSKRLIHGLSVSDESEESMISKLEVVCGFEYAHKLRRMVTDLSLSKDLTDEFKEHFQRNHGDMDIDFNVMVLGTHFWPLNHPSHDFVIPVELLPTYDRFQAYYRKRNSGRKLKWLWNHSKNELHTRYLNQKYILVLSSYQMAVLLQYNSSDTLSLADLVSATAITTEILAQVIAPLVKAKILINEDAGRYSLNLNFKSQKVRVNLFVRSVEPVEPSDVFKAVDGDRKYAIQSAIVRIMKARTTMKGQLLIEEVVSQISQQFTPNITDVKKAIATLLEKEYIQETEDTPDTYTYAA